MPLPGKGFLAIWNDVEPANEAEWLRWHTIEHMPERVGVPGFLGGRRYADWRLARHRFFTLYLGEAVTTFNSPPYLERLDNPTPWTTRLAPHFRNFLRGACRIVASDGHAIGGAIATVRLKIDDFAKASNAAETQALVARLMGLEGVVAAHIGLQETSVSGVQTKEKALRGDGPATGFAGVVLVEGLGRREIEARLAAIANAIRSGPLGLMPAETNVYDLCLHLGK